MFSLPTVFIIGAGANAELGMPTGATLKERIGKALNFGRDSRGLLVGNRQFYELIGARFRDLSDIYYDGGTELSGLIGRFESIDEALHWFSARPEIVSLGKASIVRNILAAERASDLFDSFGPNLAVVRNVLAAEPASKLLDSPSPNLAPRRVYQEVWASEFLAMAIGSFKREEAKDIFSRVTIINFNYDRTVEHFLFSELQTAFKLESVEAQQAVSNLKTIRPYGSVGPLPWQADDGVVPFGHDFGSDHDRLFQVSSNIRTFTEQAAGDVRPQIQAAIAQASVIVILGFGFHQQNMELLTSAQPGGKRIFATVFSIDGENYESLKINIRHTFRDNGIRPPQLLDRRSYKLLQTMKLAILARI
jgi:hypothetical protein